MLNTYQILAPARDKEVGKAAIQAGADAVYIGAPLFGARQAASNSIEDLLELISYAHLYGTEVLITLNTLMDDDERKEAARMAHTLYEIGADALIIQDMRLLEESLPPIRLHASTQCDNRTPEQVLRLQQMGFRRAVLARELSLSEIREIRQRTHEEAARAGIQPIELEAFIHGSLCVSYSGRCYLSEDLMGRSANRGCCAQMCRMAYDLLDKEGNVLHSDRGEPYLQKYPLSLQDLDRSPYLKQMMDAGITTFKIEGRLKEKEYVTNIVAYYRQRLDSILKKETECQYTFTPNPEKTFHRGKTDYFLNGRKGKMANWDTPKSTGEPIGQVREIGRNFLRIQLLEGVEIHNGDGICYSNQGFMVNRVEGDKVFPHRMPPVRLGTPLYRNLDTEFLRSLHAMRRIAVDITFRETSGGYLLTIGNETREFASEHIAANNAQRALNTIREQLSKLGDTVYVARNIDLRLSQPYFIPIAQLNAWRREVTAALIAHSSIPREDTPLSHLQSTEKAVLSSMTTPDTMKISEKSVEIVEHVESVERCFVSPREDGTPLMTCRYCILHELGHCRKQSPMSNEPKFLRLKNGTLLQVSFDCAQCEMKIFGRKSPENLVKRK